MFTHANSKGMDSGDLRYDPKGHLGYTRFGLLHPNTDYPLESRENASLCPSENARLPLIRNRVLVIDLLPTFGVHPSDCTTQIDPVRENPKIFRIWVAILFGTYC